LLAIKEIQRPFVSPIQVEAGCSSASLDIAIRC
jgi:hypothetical protein